MSNTEQSSFLSKSTPPAFLRVIQWLFLGLIVMVGAQLTRVIWQNHRYDDRVIALGLLLSTLVGLYIIMMTMMKELRDGQQ